ncbi:MAG: hypothetical protein ACW98K_05850 [Candidatus Kariarchaeaceae archaeon]
MIRHLLILEQSGLPLFTRSYEKGIDCCSDEHSKHQEITEKSMLVGGFLSAIKSFASEFGGDLQQARLGQWDLYIHDEKNITSVLLTKPNEDQTKNNLYIERVETIAKLFVEKYNLDFSKWDGNTTTFNNFSEVIDRYHLTDTNTIQKSLCTSCIDDFGKILKLKS